MHPLVKPITTIGRSPDNDIVLDDASVSRHHARVVRTAEGFHLEDLNSFNGTTVGRAPSTATGPRCLDESELHIGDVPLRFAQPRSAAIGSKTMVRGVEHSVLPRPGSPRPRRRPPAR